jgi:hypothetical protein
MKTEPFPKVPRAEKPANIAPIKISTIYSFCLKIKFLDKAHIAYFSAKFYPAPKRGTKLKTPLL